MKYHGRFESPIWNGCANSIPILDGNRPIHLIHLSDEKDPFPSISYSHIPVRSSRAPPPLGFKVNQHATLWLNGSKYSKLKKQ